MREAGGVFTGKAAGRCWRRRGRGQRKEQVQRAEAETHMACSRKTKKTTWLEYGEQGEEWKKECLER